MTVGEHQCASPRCRGCGKRVGEEHETHCVCVMRPDYYPAPRKGLQRDSGETA
jgi:hypothetical protein